MATNYFFLARLGFIILTLLCLVLVLMAVKAVFRRMGLDPATATRRTRVIGAIIMGWLVIVGFLAFTGFLSDFSSSPPKIPLVALPPLLAILWLTFSDGFRAFLHQVPNSWLLWLQVFRIPVEILLWWLFLADALPVQMTFEGRNWDILTGLTAPVFAVICFGGTRNKTWLAVVWNLLGLGLLLNIVGTAILSLPTPFRVFLNEPSSILVTTFPIIYLPTALVPLAYALHFFSLRKLWLERKKA